MTQDVNVVVQETVHPVTVVVEESINEIVVEVANLGLVGAPGRATADFLEGVASAEDAATAAIAADASASESKDAAQDARDLAVGAQEASELARDESVAAKNQSVSAKTASETARDESVAAKNQSVSAKTASETARDESTSAKTESELARDESVSAKTASESARDTSVEAKEQSVTAKTSSETARDAASSSADSAASSADTASAAASSASDYASSANSSAGTASTAADDSEAAMLLSQTARDQAQAARDAAQGYAQGITRVWTGTAYPARVSDLPNFFFGPENPDELGLMTVIGDTWINTDQTAASAYTVEEVYTAALAAKASAEAAAVKFPANGLAVYDYNVLRNADFKQGADGFANLLFSSAGTGTQQVRLSDPDYIGDYMIQLTNGSTTTGNNVIEWSSLGRIPWNRNERWVFSIDIASDTAMQIGGTFLPNDITTNAFITTLNSTERSAAIPGDGQWYRCQLVFDTNAWPANTGTARIRFNGIPQGAIVKVRRPKFGKSYVYTNPSSKGVYFNTEFNRYEQVGLSSDDIPWFTAGTLKSGSLLVPDASKVSGWRWTDTTYLEGSGSPVGVVSALPGTEYVDTLATNGARKWRKITGTSTTGWVCVEGDTGWREMAGTMSNGWAAANFRVRRIGSQVFCNWVGLDATNNTGDTSGPIVNGFRPLTTHKFFVATVYGGAPVSSNIVIGPTGNNGYLRCVGTKALFDPSVGSTYSWATDDAWPTTLPGV